MIGVDITPEDILQALLRMLSITFLRLSVSQFIFYVGLLNHELDSLNGLLHNFFNYKPIRIIDNFELYVTQVRSSQASDESLIKLRAAIKVYSHIFEIGSLISDSFGLTMLIMLINFVIAVTASGYEAFIIAVGGLVPDNIRGKSSNFISETMHWFIRLENASVVVISIAVLVLIISCCHETQRLVSSKLTLLSYHIQTQSNSFQMTTLLSTVSRIGCDKYDQLRRDTRSFLRNSCLQLTHQPVIFTAFGFYTINFSLLASIVKGIVSDPIILVRFYAS